MKPLILLTLLTTLFLWTVCLRFSPECSSVLLRSCLSLCQDYAYRFFKSPRLLAENRRTFFALY